MQSIITKGFRTGWIITKGFDLNTAGPPLVVGSLSSRSLAVDSFAGVHTSASVAVDSFAGVHSSKLITADSFSGPHFSQVT